MKQTIRICDFCGKGNEPFRSVAKKFKGEGLVRTVFTVDKEREIEIDVDISCTDVTTLGLAPDTAVDVCEDCVYDWIAETLKDHFG